ncbi:unnamed protein product [Leptidea sinapis]|uniref:Uncharacterized protein n=1 Tax=Leptidea sinapis TaxID=189913 RepID=A0A5E4QQF1_9NEOP|nr:unnamed protein product [Leptidea sinapis]
MTAIDASQFRLQRNRSSTYSKMFAKSTVTLFVIAVGLSSLLSGNGIGSASAYPRPDETSMNPDLDPKDVKLFEEVYQKHIMVGGKLPGDGHTYGGVTYSSGNAIEQSDSSSKNFLGSLLSQQAIYYHE